MTRAKKSRPAKPTAVDTLMSDAALRETAAMLALVAPGVEPPARVKERLLARVRGASPAPTSGWAFGALAAETGWVPLRFPGVRMREVTIDTARDTALLYVEMQPGAIFPDHDHTAAERGVVLTGDLVMSGRCLGAGDFYEAAAGTQHERISSPSGCTGLLWVGAAAWRTWRAALAAAR